MYFKKMDELPKKTFPDHYLQPMVGQNLMFVKVVLKPDYRPPYAGDDKPHKHPHEQITYVIKGKLKCQVAGNRKIIGPGELVYIPPNTEHFLENGQPGGETEVFDIYTPIRKDILP